jgi:hypothetical protein
MAINRFDEDDERKELVKIRDTINKYGGEKYGIDDAMIGWEKNLSDPASGTVQIGGESLMDVSKENIFDERSYAPETDIRTAIDTYATKNKLAQLSPIAQSVGIEIEPALNTGYEDPYSAQVDKLMKQIQNREEFTFNLQSDPSFKALQQQYEVQGSRAMEDVMGAASQMTGGRPSSWSETVAGQTKSRFDEALLGQVPQLEQAAYNKYLQEGQSEQQALQNLMSERSYERSTYEADRNYDRIKLESNRLYNRGILESDRMYNQNIKDSKEASARWEKEFDYGVTRDQVNDKNWLDQFDYGKQQDAIQNAYRNKQLSIQEAERALNLVREADNNDRNEISNYMSYAINQLEAGKSEEEIKTYLKGLNTDKQISDAVFKEVNNRFPSLKKYEEESGTNALSILYGEMMSSPDPKQWLIESSTFIEPEELKTLEKMLPGSEGPSIVINTKDY